MPIDPVKIPQNVYVEDRIIGPITLRQIIITLAGAGLSYAIWSIMKSSGSTNPVETGIAWTPCVIAILFAFVKVNNLSLTRIVLLSLEKLEKPSVRKWHPHQGLHINIVTKKIPKHEEKVEQDRKEQETDTRIRELSAVLDQGPTEVTEAEEVSEVAEHLPVNPLRVKAEALGNEIIDGITGTALPQSPSAKIVRDISPSSPQS